MKTGLVLSMSITGCNTTQIRTGLVLFMSIICWSTTQMRAGLLLAATPHNWELVLSYPWALLAATPHKCPIHEYCLWPCQSQEALCNFPVPKDLVAVVFQKILLLWCCVAWHVQWQTLMVSIFFQFGQLHVWWLSPLWVTCWEGFTELHKHTLIGMAWLSVLTVSNGSK